MSVQPTELTTCGLSIAELIAEGGLYCGNCGEWRIISADGDVADCRDCDEGWNLYAAADDVMP